MANCCIIKTVSGYKLKISKVDDWLRRGKITENDAYDGKKNLLITNIKLDTFTETFKFNNEVLLYNTYINFLFGKNIACKISYADSYGDRE